MKMTRLSCVALGALLVGLSLHGAQAKRQFAVDCDSTESDFCVDACRLGCWSLFEPKEFSECLIKRAKGKHHQGRECTFPIFDWPHIFASTGTCGGGTDAIVLSGFAARKKDAEKDAVHTNSFLLLRQVPVDESCVITEVELILGQKNGECAVDEAMKITVPAVRDPDEARMRVETAQHTNLLLMPGTAVRVNFPCAMTIASPNSATLIAYTPKSLHGDLHIKLV